MRNLEKHAPLKKKYIRGNHLRFMNKELFKAVMHRSKLRNNFLELRSNRNRIYCVSLLRRIKKNYYSNLNEKNITDDKKFWKTVTPFLSDKVLSTERIENDKIINNDNETANIMNTFFSNIVINLSVPEYRVYEGISRNISDPILKAIVKYKNHPSITAIKRVSNSNDLFSFDIVDREKILKEISSLVHTKTCQESDIPTKIIKENADIFPEVLHLSFNASVNEGTFPSIFKLADITSIFKKDSKNSKDNYRPISILKYLSKVFENIMYTQMATFMDKYFS